jgi:hypothetical protein
MWHTLVGALFIAIAFFIVASFPYQTMMWWAGVLHSVLGGCFIARSFFENIN